MPPNLPSPPSSEAPPPVPSSPSRLPRPQSHRLSRLVLGALAVGGALVTLARPAAAAPPLIEVSISPEGRVKASSGEARPELLQGGWTEFEIVIENTAGLTSPLAIGCRQVLKSDDDAARSRWLKLEVVPSGPLTGAAGEKRTLRLWSRDAGRRAAVFNVDAGQGSQDLGFRSDVLVTFVIKGARDG